MQNKDYLSKERRKYIRLDSVFPVQFRLVSLDGKQYLSGWLQGFTNNIGKGGLCLEVNNLNPDLARMAKEASVKLLLEIEMPVTGGPVSALSRVAWVKEMASENNKYFFGLTYENIDLAENRKIMRYAWMKKLFIPIALAAVIVLGLGVGINTFININLVKGNRVIVEQLVNVLRETGLTKQAIKQITQDRESLQLKIRGLESRIRLADEEKAKKDKVKTEEINKLGSLIEKLNQEKGLLQQELAVLKRKEVLAAEELLRLGQEKAALEQANIDKMCQWLGVHQNPRTGLVMSFEGDSDIENWGFTYDQSLAVLVYANFSQTQRAKKILDFFKYKAKRIDGRFLNAYYVNDGNPAEYIVHSGPNIWLGIAVVQYTYKTQDKSYLDLAEDIARATIDMQNKDADGGIRGGPTVEWYATEHNLDAYAFFNMLYKLTRNPEYARSRDKVLNWLVEYSYGRGDIPVKRGKGDSTVATDTYAWSIAALGPQKLEELGMNPERIVEFAQQYCGVEVSYIRPEGNTVKIRGFDFAPQRHLARGSVVSSEWTAQMIIAFKIMADFYSKKNMPDKAHTYASKADNYLAELGNMIISSPSPSGQGESCLPYATQDYVDTGHGWMTPKGSRTGSVSGTAYAIFAYYNYNPLELKE